MPRYPRISDTPDRFDNQGNKLCRNCDNPVVKRRRHYCSEKCRNKFTRDHLWVFVRMDVLKRDKYKCGICRKRFRKKQLDVDHIVPVKAGGSLFDKSNLRTLCKECHKFNHRI